MITLKGTSNTMKTITVTMNDVKNDVSKLFKKYDIDDVKVLIQGDEPTKHGTLLKFSNDFKLFKPMSSWVVKDDGIRLSSGSI